jgi:hypothetical protein
MRRSGTHAERLREIVGPHRDALRAQRLENQLALRDIDRVDAASGAACLGGSNQKVIFGGVFL